MSELEELVRLQWQEMYELGKRHGKSEELASLALEIQAEFTRDKGMSYYTADKITKMIRKRIKGLEGIE